MYNILFHVSGIAILEICFYFYYIGPMETKIFEKVVGRLATEMVKLVNDNMDLLENMVEENLNTFNPTPSSYLITNNEIDIPLNPSTIVPARMLKSNQVYNLADLNRNYVENFFSGLIPSSNGNNTAENDRYMNNIRNDAKDERKEKNDKLFIKIIEYWSILAGVSIFIYLVEHKYKIYKKLKKERGIVPVTSEEDDIEMQNIVRYRKGSDTEENIANDNNDENQNAYCSKNCIQRLGYILHYVIFGCCIIGFQYLFFENVVLKYDPLSIDEVKYLLYIKFRPILIQLGY